MSDRVSRLLTAIEEAERLARATISTVNPTTGEWAPAGEYGTEIRDSRDHLVVKHSWPDEIAHIAHNDPAAVLRRRAVDRELVEWCEGWQRTFRGPIPEGHTEESALHFRMAAEYLITRLEAAYGISVEEETTGE